MQPASMGAEIDVVETDRLHRPDDAPATDGLIREEPGSSSAPSPGDQGFLLPLGIGAFLQVLTSLAGGGAVFTGMVFTFGYVYGAHFYNYLGVPIPMLGFSTQEYLVLSVNTLFYGACLLLLIAFLVISCRVKLNRLKAGGRHDRTLKVLAGATAVAGVTSLIAGTVLALVPVAVGLPNHAFLAAGFILVTCAWSIRRNLARDGNLGPGHPQELRWVAGARRTLIAVGLLVSVWALFLAFAAWTGGLAAKAETSGLPDAPRAVVYSERRLALDAPGVEETIAIDAAEAYRFRYRGLVLVWRSDDRYLFVPESWSPKNKVLFSVPDTAGVRVDFRSRSVESRSG
ncbi:MAG TPA: hypothetical protein VFV02_12385 [Acidimicrobiales bacterium]|nr:hypothetical protein [Acidimicrobiales bacterium]